MTHEPGVDDGDLEIEAWEVADAQLAASGMSEAERKVFWNSIAPNAGNEGFLELWAEQHGVSLAEAHRQIWEMNGVTL